MPRPRAHAWRRPRPTSERATHGGSCAQSNRAARDGGQGTEVPIDATGTFLFADNQESDSISAFRIDPRTGVLSDTGARASVPSPVYVR
ncbi:MAG: beta-propeller fold lactonase family protein [Acidobacteria bacterium]|nr:beta-propeller fold lactonase family protein [Acidobacteriota bacterium]